MPSKQVQHRGDVHSALMLALIAAREIVVDTTNGRIHLGNGIDLGGLLLPNGKDVQSNDLIAAVATGSADAIELAPYLPVTAYQKFQGFIFQAISNNTGAVTIKLPDLAPRPAKKRTPAGLADLAADDIIQDGVYRILDDGTNYQVEACNAIAGLVSVSQANLNTSTGSFSSALGGIVSSAIVSVKGNEITLPGGQYGFFPASSRSGFSGNSSTPFWAISESSSSTIASVIALHLQVNSNFTSQNSGTLFGLQRYVTSSPPYDLGEGDVGGFVYALVNNAGDIVAHYAADTPPWAYNGPTDIRCTKICGVTGKKFRRVREKRTLEEILDGASAKYDYQEITHEIKNADMDLLPHPFGTYDSDLTCVLLDPMDERIRRIIHAQNDGEDISDAIKKGLIRVDNDSLHRRRGPKGVSMHRLKFKNYGGK